MAYGRSNDDVIDDVTWPWKVKVVIPISIRPVISYKIHLADICTLWAPSSLCMYLSFIVHLGHEVSPFRLILVPTFSSGSSVLHFRSTLWCKVQNWLLSVCLSLDSFISCGLYAVKSFHTFNSCSTTFMCSSSQSSTNRKRLIRFNDADIRWTEMFKAFAPNTPGISDAESGRRLPRDAQYQESIPFIEILRYLF